MATAWCPRCGAEYIEGVRECLDCLVALGERRPTALDQVGGPADEQLAYELESLSPAERLDLDQRLARRGIARAWDGDALVVRLADETAVDALIDDSARDAVRSDPDNVAFDLDDWTETSLDELRAALDTAGLDFVLDDGELVVHGVDEDQAESLIDLVEFPDQLPTDDAEGQGDEADGGDGLAAQDAMSDLFVAADRLLHDPEDAEGVLSAVDAAERAAALAVPYGFAPAVWRDVVARAGTLRDAIEADADDETVIDAATALRTKLRQFV